MKVRAVQAMAFVVFAILGAWVWLFSFNDKDVPDPKFLASDLFFQMNGFAFSVPAVAMQDISVLGDDADPLPRYRYNARLFGGSRWFATLEYKAALADFAGNQERPANIQSIKLDLGAYGTYGEYLVSTQICALLTQEWSKKACANELRHEQRHLPLEFSLTTTEGLPINLDGAVSFQDTNAPQKLTLFCDEESDRCTAIVEIFRNVHALWSSTCKNSNVEYCLRKRRVEGRALSDFVRTQLREDSQQPSHR